MAILKIYDEATKSWQEIVAFKGDKGDKGDKGEDGLKAPVVQTTGDSTTSVMSQKAVTEAVQPIANYLNYEVTTPSEWNVGYRSIAGEIMPSSAYRYSEPIAVKKGTLLVGMENTSSYVAAVRRVDEFGGTGEVVVRNFTETTEVRYVCDFDGYVSISTNVGYTDTWYAISSPIIADNYSKQVDLEGMLYAQGVGRHIAENGVTRQFQRDTKLIYVPNYVGALKDWKYGAFLACTNLREVYMPSASYDKTCELYQMCQGDAAMESFVVGSINLTGTCQNVFLWCYRLVRVAGDFNFTDGVNSVVNFFFNCVNLTTIEGTWSNLKLDFSASSSPLTRESALVIINGLYDFTQDADYDASVTHTLTLSSTTKALLTDADRTLCTSKGWTIA